MDKQSSADVSWQLGCDAPTTNEESQYDDRPSVVPQSWRVVSPISCFLPKTFNQLPFSTIMTKGMIASPLLRGRHDVCFIPQSRARLYRPECAGPSERYAKTGCAFQASERRSTWFYYTRPGQAARTARPQTQASLQRPSESWPVQVATGQLSKRRRARTASGAETIISQAQTGAWPQRDSDDALPKAFAVSLSRAIPAT